MNIKIKKLSQEAVIPTYAKPGDAGMDLTAIGASWDGPEVTYHTGLAVEIPEGYVGLLFPRSSVYKTGQSLTNCVGVIDSGYRGEIMLKFRRSLHVLSPDQRMYQKYKEYNIGDRVGQLLIMPFPYIEFKEVAELNETSRGEGGYGSTGN